MAKSTSLGLSDTTVLSLHAGTAVYSQPSLNRHLYKKDRQEAKTDTYKVELVADSLLDGHLSNMDTWCQPQLVNSSEAQDNNNAYCKINN